MTQKGGGGPPPLQFVSVPPYPRSHTGTALVVGSAWCAPDDVACALAHSPGAVLIGVNRSVAHFDCPIMVALDNVRAERWKSLSRIPTELHGGRFGAQGRAAAYPWFNYWWDQAQGGGTSALMATRIALAIGFEDIILCGVPLEPGPYLDGEDNWSDRTHAVMEAYRNPWRRDSVWLQSRVRSMSGWTQTLLGDIQRNP